MAGRPRAFATVEELQQGIDAYIAQEIADGYPVTVSGLAAHLEIGRSTLFDYANGVYGEEYSDTIKRAISIIEADKLKKALKGEYNATIAIFDLKNNHGYKDQQHIDTNEKKDVTHKIDEGSAVNVAGAVAKLIQESI